MESEMINSAPSKTNQSGNKSGIIQKVVSILGFLLFAMFSSLQGNDVGQYGTAQWLTYAWIIGYGALAFICLYNALHPIKPRVFQILAGVTFALALFRASQIDWNQPLFCFIAPEEFAKRYPAGNETGGLIIMTLWLLLVCMANKKRLRNL